MIDQSTAELVGAVGVFMLLAAFVANAYGRLASSSVTYYAINGVGAAIACAASVMIGFRPFVVLEGVWALAAFGAMLRSRT